MNIANIDGWFELTSLQRERRIMDGDVHFRGLPVTLDARGYPVVHLAGRDQLVHRLVVKTQHGGLATWLDVHHIDQDKTNWDISNLAVVTRDAHENLHAQLQRIDNQLHDAYQARNRALNRTLDEAHRRGLTAGVDRKSVV